MSASIRVHYTYTWTMKQAREDTSVSAAKVGLQPSMSRHIFKIN
ncbi:hypothetical protein OAS67_05585 [Alphaproteobacteria bacterium]|nr:hypothetical protein [Alphaproteobacteria bacterium]